MGRGKGRDVLLSGKPNIGGDRGWPEVNKKKKKTKQVIPHYCPVVDDEPRSGRNPCTEVLDKETHTVCPKHGNLKKFLKPLTAPEGKYEYIYDLSKKREERDKKKAARAANKKDYVGNCPVILRSGTGDAIGVCDEPIYGTYCRKHGNLKGRLKSIGTNKSGFEHFKNIETNRY